jgi:integrase
LKLTDLTIRALTPPAAGQVTHFDDGLKSFGVRVSKGGSKSFILLVGAERRRVTIGRYGIISLADARAEAKRILAERTLGAHHTPYQAYSDAKDAYLAYCNRKNRHSTYMGYKSRLDRLDWGKKNLSDITPRDIIAKLDALDDLPMEKRYTFVVARTFFNWCLAQHKLDTSPMARMQAPPLGKSRERVLTLHELKSVWDASPDDAFGKTVRVLILTGQRRGEVAHMTVEGDMCTIPSIHTKNHRTHIFPVPGIAAQLLTTPLEWGGWGKSKAKLDNASGVANWTLHDLRRTYATLHAQLKTPPHIIEALLNHKSGIISGVAATYNRFLYIEEMREAVNNYESYLTKLMAE